MSALIPVEQNDRPQPRMTERELASALICANNGFPEVVDKIGVERSREYLRNGARAIMQLWQDLDAREKAVPTTKKLEAA
ncbi:hypothetical protein [Gluconobacter albidus]|uniref:KfrA N-terminal DNA-binding domain-containing protein n=1 Tax=Gluconobacter albidus TaxID=318683 RepID=A0AAW3QXI5_9PROT|nr:hypothetical protein [Gluconobacter albidus]KXV39468.1 hypothetical protein AD941_05080 [Gluconobacter albidus]GBQ90942.1 hypothetical protein AA3250_2176 [Gluconobacter albidus NBRC 3250]GLQ69355.1 hypothetical protein GCM10007866_18060 [Gluconobacter albidus]